MILDLHRQGAGVSAIARRTGLDRKTVRKVIAGGLEPPVYGPRPRRVRGSGSRGTESSSADPAPPFRAFMPLWDLSCRRVPQSDTLMNKQPALPADPAAVSGETPDHNR